MQDERTDGKEEKEETADDLFPQSCSQKYRDGVNVIFFVTGDILEVFDGEGEEVSDKEGDKNWEGEFFESIFGSYGHESGYQNEDTGRCRDESR